MKKTLTALALTALALLTGCGTNNFRDVEGVDSHEPEHMEVFSNVDGHPNLAYLCIHGVAFITTTRDYSAVTRVPDLDRHCDAPDGRKGKRK